VRTAKPRARRQGRQVLGLVPADQLEAAADVGSVRWGSVLRQPRARFVEELSTGRVIVVGEDSGMVERVGSMEAKPDVNALHNIWKRGLNCGRGDPPRRPRAPVPAPAPPPPLEERCTKMSSASMVHLPPVARLGDAGHDEIAENTPRCCRSCV
jgi:hypothetical protein